MKISKLFHWLYAFLMALPIFAVLSACLISTFNMSSKQESEIHYKYQTNNVNSNIDIISGNIYLFNFKQFHLDIGIDSLISSNSNGFLDLQWLNYDGYELFLPSNSDVNIEDISHPLTHTDLLFDSSLADNIFFYGWLDNVLSLEFYTFDFYYFIDDMQYFDVPFVVRYFSADGFNVDFYKYVKPVTDLSFIPIDYVEEFNVETQDIFYNAIDKVRQSPLFSWAYDSNILGVPIAYIGGIFGLASNSIVNVLLCYWVAISIIWLVFDVLMFVPLLVHKTIDKMRF